MIDPREIAPRLLGQIGLRDHFKIEPLPGGRNNRVWRLRTGGTDYLLKQYYWTETDRRDRMGHEWDFLNFLHGIGCSRAAKPLAADREHRFALIEFIDGVTPGISEIAEPEIASAADFFSEMNAARCSAAGRALFPASESCFSFGEHLETTERRIARLGQIAPDGEENRPAMAFVSETLLPLWESVRARVAAAAHAISGVLDPAERCLSPSDFGFHNSLRTSHGSIRFVDFEYAGWDDPAKTIADFANQPDMLLDARLSDIFSARAIDIFHESREVLSARVRLLTPLYQVKWACICLNEFLPAGSVRRAFTGLGAGEARERLAGHLERARIMAARAANSLDFQ